MKINKKLISLISLLATSNSYAIQQFNVNNNAEVEASISNNDVSRIAVVGAKINQVKFSNSQLKIDTDDENGQIFVYPTGVNNLDVKQITVGGASKEATVSPLISLFIIDDHGRSYNLRLRLSAVPSETILINPIHAHGNTSSGIAGSTDFTNQVVTICRCHRKFGTKYARTKRQKYCRFDRSTNRWTSIRYSGHRMGSCFL